MRLVMADLVERDRAQHGAEEAARVLRRSQVAVSELEAISAAEAALTARAIGVDSLSRADRDRATKARTALRTAATRLRDADKEVLAVVTTQGLVEAIESSEHLVGRRESAISSAFATFRASKRPPGIEDVISDGLRPYSLAIKVDRLKKAFLSEAPVRHAGVIEAYEALTGALAEWEDLQPDLEKAREEISPALESFLRRAREGVPWGELTPEVRSWLDREGESLGFVVVRRGRHD
jgi:chromosome segregation ATPase